ncbi:hypothetical protein NPIL_340241 [Nephila pilipes]|uniref:Uncharacterized protein n=1 Tax=Nephila pilipes TaxID=299642 RepID=A0A8X6U6C4_NEPPI|nr:hypothetical protein NPIL_340241 [Nephila pilipes]
MKTAWEVRLLFFFDCRGSLLIDFQHQGCTINSTQYCNTLTKLRKAIKSQIRPFRTTRDPYLRQFQPTLLQRNQNDLTKFQLGSVGTPAIQSRFVTL